MNDSVGPEAGRGHDRGRPSPTLRFSEVPSPLTRRGRDSSLSQASRPPRVEDSAVCHVSDDSPSKVSPGGRFFCSVVPAGGVEWSVTGVHPSEVGSDPSSEGVPGAVSIMVLTAQEGGSVQKAAGGGRGGGGAKVAWHPRQWVQDAHRNAPTAAQHPVQMTLSGHAQTSTLKIPETKCRQLEQYAGVSISRVGAVSSLGIPRSVARCADAGVAMLREQGEGGSKGSGVARCWSPGPEVGVSSLLTPAAGDGSRAGGVAPPWDPEVSRGTPVPSRSARLACGVPGSAPTPIAESWSKVKSPSTDSGPGSSWCVGGLPFFLDPKVPAEPPFPSRSARLSYRIAGASPGPAAELPGV